MQLPRLKAQFKEELASDLRAILKENTVDIFIIDMQAEVLALSFKHLDEFLGGEGMLCSDDEKERMRNHIFKEAAASMMDFYAMYDENSNKDAREWFNGSYSSMLSGDVDSPGRLFYRTYYSRLRSDMQINAIELISLLNCSGF